jgi:hypothetical protein
MVRALIQDVKDEALKTTSSPKDKLRSDHQSNNETSNLEATDSKSQSLQDEKGTHELNQGSQAGEDYPQLLRTYLHRRRPVFLRQRLDQYYYPDLMNSTPREGDQVVMRQFSEDKKRLRLQADQKYIQLLEMKKELEDDEWKPETTTWQRVVKRFLKHSRAKKLAEVQSNLDRIEQLSYLDENSPVLLIDQLWMWIIDEGMLRNSSHLGLD